MQDVYASRWSPRKVTVRRTVDLQQYPDLVVMYIGMRVNRPQGLLTVMKFGRVLHKALHPYPEGLLHSERMLFSPRQVGWRQYWRDIDSLAKWARAAPHREWWMEFLQHPRGAGLWHETYFMRGGMEAVFDAMPVDVGLMAFAPTHTSEGTMFQDRLARPPPSP